MYHAYRYLNEFEQIVGKESSDGEPRGTSGTNFIVLSGAGNINSAAIIVRYFGGIKLNWWVSKSLWWFFLNGYKIRIF